MQSILWQQLTWRKSPWEIRADFKNKTVWHVSHICPILVPPQLSPDDQVEFSSKWSIEDHGYITLHDHHKLDLSVKHLKHDGMQSF